MKILSKNEKELIAQVQKFASVHVAPNASTWERERRFGVEAIKQAGGLGLTGIEVPTEHGGLVFHVHAKSRFLKFWQARISVFHCHW